MSNPFDGDDSSSRRQNKSKPTSGKPKNPFGDDDDDKHGSPHKQSTPPRSSRVSNPFDDNDDQHKSAKSAKPSSSRKPSAVANPFDDDEEHTSAKSAKPSSSRKPSAVANPFDDDDDKPRTSSGKPATISAVKPSFDDDSHVKPASGKAVAANPFDDDVKRASNKKPASKVAATHEDDNGSSSINNKQPAGPASTNPFEEKATSKPLKVDAKTALVKIDDAKEEPLKAIKFDKRTAKTADIKPAQPVKPASNPFGDDDDEAKVPKTSVPAKQTKKTSSNPFGGDEDDDHTPTAAIQKPAAAALPMSDKSSSKASSASRRSKEEIQRDPFIKSFENAFDDVDYIKRITQNLLSQMEHGELPLLPDVSFAFPADPFLNAFSFCNSELDQVSAALDEQLRAAQQSNDQASKTYHARLATFYKQCDEISEGLATLEEPFGTVGSQVVRIGEQMSVLEKQRTRADDAKMLLQHIVEFNTGMETSDIFLNESRIHEAAIVAKRLQTIAQDLDSQQTNLAKEAIDAYCKRVERSLLEMLNDSFRGGDITTMKKTAQSLHDFNGGPIAVNQFIEKHPLMQKARVAKSKQLEDHAAYVHSHTVQGLKELMDEVQGVFARDAVLVGKVFPNAEFVMSLFVQRVLAALLPTYITALLGRTKKGLILDEPERLPVPPSNVVAGFNAIPSRFFEKEEPPMPYLDTLCQVFQMSTALFKNLQQYNFDGLLDMKQLTEDSFGAFIGHGVYVEEEASYLQATLMNILTPFYQSKIERKTNVSKSRGKIWSGVDKHAAGSPVLAPGSTTGKSGPQVITSSDTINDLSAETSLEILHAHADATKRCLKLSSSTDAPENVLRLFTILVDSLCHSYIDAAADMALEMLSHARDSKNDPPLETLDTVMTISLIVHLLQKHFQDHVASALPKGSSAFRQAMMLKNKALSIIEVEINSIMELLVYEIEKKLTRVLAKQNKSDFRPKEAFGISVSAPSNQASAVCSEITGYLHKVFAIAKRDLDGENLESFVSELGSRFYHLLLDHIRKFTVNNAGGLVLARELTEYQYSVRAFNISSVNEQFDTLRQLGNIFVVRPDNLKLLISEGALSNLDRELIQTCIAQRDDFRKEKLDLFFAEAIAADV